MPVSGLEKWRLIQLLRRHDIDEQEVDWSLSRQEIIEQVRRLVGMTEQDYIRYMIEHDQVIPENEQRLINDCREIAQRERRSIKQAKYDMGRRILQDENYLISRYGDDYFGRLARLINRRGYSADQLRKCVKFAQLPEGTARQLIACDDVGWEVIRRVVLRERRPTEPQIIVNGCIDVINYFHNIARIYATKTDFCKRYCKFSRLCRRISKEVESLRQLPVRQS